MVITLCKSECTLELRGITPMLHKRYIAVPSRCYDSGCSRKVQSFVTGVYFRMVKDSGFGFAH